MLAFVQAGVAVWVVVVWTLILVLGGGYSLGEMIRLLTGKQPLWKRVVFFPARVVAGRIEKAIKTQIARASHQFVLASPTIARQLNRYASRVEMTSAAILQTNAHTHAALLQLRRATIPELIRRALVPINSKLDRHTGRLDDLETKNSRVAVVIGNGLRGLPWGVPGTYVGNFEAWWNSYDHLWTQTFNHIQPRLNKIQFEMIPRIAARLDDLERDLTRVRTETIPALRQRIADLEKRVDGLDANLGTRVLAVLGAAMLPALSALGMQTALRNLTCRNTQTAAQRMCAADPIEFAGMIAALTAILTVGNLEWYVKGMQATVGTVTNIVTAALDPPNRDEVPSQAT